MSLDNINPIRTDITKVHSNPITLQIIIASIEAWRLTKQKLNEKIPDKIWNQIFTLTDSMPEDRIIHVLKVLGISQGQFINEKQYRKTPLISAVNISEVTPVSSINQVTLSNVVPNSPETALNLEKAVESTTSAYCTESSRVFDDFSLHRMGDTVSVKKSSKTPEDSAY